MIPYAPHPILFSIGPLDVRYYSLGYLIGFLITYVWLKRRYGADRAEDALFWLVLATIVGGRVGEFVFYSPSTFWTDPLEVLRIWHGGMSFHGGLIALFVTSWLYCRHHKLPFGRFADTIVIPGVIGVILVRLANFLNGELVGTLTAVPWCMQFPGYAGCRHPSQLYEAAYSALLLVVLVWQYRKSARVKPQDGFLFVLFVTMYGALRFVFNFLRDDPRWLGISMGQALSLIMFCIGVWLLGTKYKKSVSKMFS